MLFVNIRFKTRFRSDLRPDLCLKNRLRRFCITCSRLLGSRKNGQNPIFSHLGPRYHFLIARKLISGQKYYRNAKQLKKSGFFAKKIFRLQNTKNGQKLYFQTFRAEVSFFNHAESDQRSKLLRKHPKTEKNDFFAKKNYHQPANIGKSAQISKCVFSKMV